MALTTNNYWQQESNIFVLVWNIVTITTNAEVGSIAFKSFVSQIFFSPKICANLWYWSNLASEFRPRFNFITSSKHQQQNTDQTPASTLCSKSEQKLNFMTKPQLPNLQQTVANTILIINISNRNNCNKFWVGIFTRQGHINQVY